MTAKNPDIEKLELIKASGLLNPSATLDKVMETTARLMAHQDAAARADGGTSTELRHTDTFIHSHFILTHTDG